MLSEKEIAEIVDRWFGTPAYPDIFNLLSTVKELRAERDAVSKQFADYIESTDLALDGYGVPNRDDVGRIGPYIRTVKLGNEVKELRKENTELRELLRKALPYVKQDLSSWDGELINKIEEAGK